MRIYLYGQPSEPLLVNQRLLQQRGYAVRSMHDLVNPSDRHYCGPMSPLQLQRMVISEMRAADAVAIDISCIGAGEAMALHDHCLFMGVRLIACSTLPLMPPPPHRQEEILDGLELPRCAGRSWRERLAPVWKRVAGSLVQWEHDFNAHHGWFFRNGNKAPFPNHATSKRNIIRTTNAR